jgi:cysteine-rich repeat protein
MRHTTETCDDGNTSANDGWSADWLTVETGWTWSGGSLTTRDTCTEIWGDGKRFNSLTTYCDDGNSAAAGWSDTCSVEIGYTWTGGTSSAPDTCTLIWGDGRRIGTETWDDGDIANGDGWSSTCTVETGWTCSGGSTTTADTWTEVWGDGKRFNSLSTYCDDGGIANGGWSDTCSVEIGYSWTGGTSSAPDTCTPIWGDSRKIGSETWDDGGISNGDGWSSTCTVELGWTCSGGSTTTADTCTEIWGDGRRFNSISTYWDDGNTASGDGWSDTCSIEIGYTWTGGTSSVADTCTPIWGDSKRMTTEPWDDGNTASGDGCSSTCEIEDGFICNTSVDPNTWVYAVKDIYKEASNAGLGESITADTLGPFTLVGTSAAAIGGTSSVAGIYQAVNVMQLVQLIQLTGSEPPTKLSNFLDNEFYWTNPMRVIANKNLGVNKRNLSSGDHSFVYFNFEMDSQPLRNIGIIYGSVVANLFLPFLFLVITIMFQVFIWAISKSLPSESNNRWVQAMIKVVNVILNQMTFSFYIRFFLIMQQYIALVSVAEFFDMNFSDWPHAISWFFAFGVAASLAAFFGFVLWLWYKKAADSEKYSKTKFDEFFRGLKKGKLFSFYILVLMLRRFFIAIWLVWFEFTSFGVKIGILIAYQVCHTGFLGFVRPYESFIDNIVEICIEVVITLILCLLAYYSNRDKWTDSAQEAIIGLILFLIALVLVATIGKFWISSNI